MDEICRIITLIASSFIGAWSAFRFCLFYYENRIKEAEKRAERIKKLLGMYPKTFQS